MSPSQERIADLWCRLMHAEIMWPSHGQYECRTCGRRHRICWEEPSPARPSVAALRREAQLRAESATADESRVCRSHKRRWPLRGWNPLPGRGIQ
jgi:hypothetical protein